FLPVSSCASLIDAEAGAIAWTDESLRDALTHGIAPATRGEWILASAQALAGLKFLPERPTTTANVAGPAGFVHAGTTATVDVSGLRSGQAACITGVGAPQWLVGPGTAKVQLPDGTSDHTVTLAWAGGSTAVTIK